MALQTAGSTDLVCVELAFLAETWRHVLGLGLLLANVVLALVEEMLVLNLSDITEGLISPIYCSYLF